MMARWSSVMLVNFLKIFRKQFFSLPIVIVFVTTCVLARCPTGWLVFNNSCFKEFMTAVTCNDAQRVVKAWIAILRQYIAPRRVTLSLVKFDPLIPMNFGLASLTERTKDISSGWTALMWDIQTGLKASQIIFNLIKTVVYSYWTEISAGMTERVPAIRVVTFVVKT